MFTTPGPLNFVAVARAVLQFWERGQIFSRLVAQNRQWTRGYQVKQALAANPKTPQPLAMGFVSQLQDADLLALMKSKDVPSVISIHARRLLTKKGKL